MNNNEYQVKLRIHTHSLLPPYYVDGIEFYTATNAQEAVAMAKSEYRDKIGILDADDYPLEVMGVTKL